VGRAESERTDGQSPEAVALDRPLDLRPLQSFAEATGKQQENRLLAQASQRERERACRGRIEPLDVVDREDDRRFRSENVQCAPDSDAERARIRAVGALLAKECYLERAAPRHRQRGKHDLELVLEQVAEASVGKPRSASAGRDKRTRNPRSRAASTPASQSVDLPIPASPSSTSAAGPSAVWSKKAWMEPSSSFLPMISPDITLQQS
jgi:hypothetical protein